MVMFVAMAAMVPLLSALATGLGWQRVHPVTGETIRAVNLLRASVAGPVVLLLVLWFLTGLPLGPGAGMTLE